MNEQRTKDYSEGIRSAVLLVHGENAHSRYFSETAFEHLTGENKELMIIPGANHVDLYDQMDVIPFEKLKEFFEKFLWKNEVQEGLKNSVIE